MDDLANRVLPTAFAGRIQSIHRLPIESNKPAAIPADAISDKIETADRDNRDGFYPPRQSPGNRATFAELDSTGDQSMPADRNSRQQLDITA
jgi:hypothetical protein